MILLLGCGNKDIRALKTCSALHPFAFARVQVRNFYVGKDAKGDPPLHLKIAAGLTTGAFGIMVASPTDLVKVSVCVYPHDVCICVSVCVCVCVCASRWVGGWTAKLGCMLHGSSSVMMAIPIDLVKV